MPATLPFVKRAGPGRGVGKFVGELVEVADFGWYCVGLVVVVVIVGEFAGELLGFGEGVKVLETHAPLTQFTVTDVTPGLVVQLLQQFPQWLGSTSVATQVVEQNVDEDGQLEVVVSMLDML
jgi:hypothetical protein